MSTSRVRRVSRTTSTSEPSPLTVADVDGRTILVQAWAASASDLDEWLPTAKEFTDSIHFVETGE